MTQTASFKDKFKQGFSIFKWELRNCSSSLTVFAILATVFIAIILTLSLVIGYRAAFDAKPFDYDSVLNAVGVFQIVASYAIFYMNAVFTIVYTIRIYSYLHNKRKADMYGSMPVNRRTFYISKTISAYILSVVPTLFFFGIIAIISICFGQTVSVEVARCYVQLLLGSIACISFYGLLSVCCGTTLNAVLTFVAVNFAYPISALFIKGTIKAFFFGIPTNMYNNNFIMKALNPLAAYDGKNIIYWLFFTAVCLLLGTWLIKKRKAESAQTSFAYYLPCYIVKLLIAFIIGMFLGVLFGSLNVFGHGYAGFIFGFILGSVPAYVISHLILYAGFSKIFKTAIPLGGLIVVVVALMGLCNFDLLGYNSYVPNIEDIKSAGLVNLDNCYFTGRTSVKNIANMASDDYTDKYNIETVTKFHNSVVGSISKKSSTEKFESVWLNLLLSDFPLEYFDDTYCVSYRLNDGRTVYRYYDFTVSNYTYYSTNLTSYIINSDEYFKNYSPAMNAKTDEIEKISINRSFYSDADGIYNNGLSDAVIFGSSLDETSKKRAFEDRQKLIEAFRKDFAEKGNDADKSESFCQISINYDKSYGETPNTFLGSILKSMIGSLDKDNDYVIVYEDYDNTIAVLKEIGVLNKDNTINKSSDYYKNLEYMGY